MGMYDQNMINPPGEPPEDPPTKYLGLQPLVRPLLRKKPIDKWTKEMREGWLASNYVPQRNLPSIEKTSALQQYLTSRVKKA